MKFFKKNKQEEIINSSNNNLTNIIMELNNNFKSLINKIEDISRSIEEVKSNISLNEERKLTLKSIEEHLVRMVKKLEENNLNQTQTIDNKISSLFEALNHIQQSISEVKENTENVKMQLEFSQSVNIKSNEVKEDVNKESKILVDKKEEFHIVDMFIDNGDIKFKISNNSTSFYIHQINQSYTLIINDAIYHTANVDLIERCFYIEGDKTGKYINIQPAECLYNKNYNDWTLIKKGKIRGSNS